MTDRARHWIRRQLLVVAVPVTMEATGSSYFRKDDRVNVRDLPWRVHSIDNARGIVWLR